MKTIRQKTHAPPVPRAMRFLAEHCIIWPCILPSVHNCMKIRFNTRKYLLEFKVITYTNELKPVLALRVAIIRTVLRNHSMLYVYSVTAHIYYYSDGSANCEMPLKVSI